MPTSSDRASPAFAVSTWSLHRRLGITYPNGPARDGPSGAVPTYGAGSVALLDLPAEIARRGIERVEICHFHLPGRDPGFLAELRAALADAGVALMTLLIDDGDPTDAANRRRDIAWVAAWIEAAGHLGATRARVIAGKQKPTAETLALSIEALRELAERGRAVGVRVITENWHDLLAAPEQVHRVLDRLDGAVGLLADFGNWHGPSKYDDLASILSRAESIHAKGRFDDAMTLDSADYGRCLDAAADAGFAGAYSLIYEGSGNDEWAAIAVERDFIAAHLADRADRAA